MNELEKFLLNELKTLQCEIDRVNSFIDFMHKNDLTDKQLKCLASWYNFSDEASPEEILEVYYED